jgi:hypothetical protein
LLTACTTAFPPAPPGAPEQARAARSYSASLRVSLEGPEFRARTRALVAFRRPDALRVEVPGPTGPRLVAVAKDGALTAVFPAERAVFEGAATPEAFGSLLGVGLAPAEVMDVLIGIGSPRLKAYRAGWGAALPRRIEATLPDGGRLSLTMEDAAVATVLSGAAFEAPAHAGYRAIGADEARSLWSGR